MFIAIYTHKYQYASNLEDIKFIKPHRRLQRGETISLTRQGYKIYRGYARKSNPTSCGIIKRANVSDDESFSNEEDNQQNNEEEEADLKTSLVVYFTLSIMYN